MTEDFRLGVMVCENGKSERRTGVRRGTHRVGLDVCVKSAMPVEVLSAIPRRQLEIYIWSSGQS